MDADAVELLLANRAFLYALAARALESWERGDAAAMREDLARSSAFLRDHVLAWADVFSDAMAKGHGTCFYSLVAWFSQLMAKRDADVVPPALMGLEEL